MGYEVYTEEARCYSVRDMLGERFESASCGHFVVVEYVNREHVVIEFERTGFRRKTKKATIVGREKPALRDPLAPTVFGKGCIGVGPHKAHEKGGADTLPFARWRAMLRRCYYKKEASWRESYQGVEVCEEWLNFQNFAEWFSENYVEGYELDKDTEGDGLLYSPETCTFIPLRDNRAKLKTQNMGAYKVYQG